MDALQQLVSLGGVARSGELRCSPKELAALRSTGGVRDLGSGWLAVDGAAPALVAARRLNGTITCVSAADHYRLAVLNEPDEPHVALPRARGVRPGRARVHRESRWTRVAGPLPVAPPAEAMARVLRCLPLQAAVVTVDSALNKRLVTVEEVYPYLVGPGSARAREALARCDSGSRSPIETLARLELEAAGLTVVSAPSIAGVGEVDLVVEDIVVIECDGFAYHSGWREYREDRRRDRALVALGYRVLRFTWEDIMANPAIVVTAALAALAAPQRSVSRG
ncbi:DUF559 domain-containing protein [Georgenia phoenicis]|uniref:DUF559 domain-containing protein n=1 Tax=unclassified Georgenia TaxID=2626815 RepID=UPI0039AFDA31